jgi:streptogramin lyase
LPTTEINTLGDILAQCVNSGGGTEGDGSACGTLFEDAPNAAGTVYPIDTITAMMNIARSPGRNVGNLLRIVAPNPVFQPALNVNFPPNDWTVAITYTGGGLSTPTSIAADATGAVWIANSGNSSVTKLSPAGAPISGSSGLSAPSAIAIDTNGNAWVANAGNNTVAKLNSALSSDTVYSGNGLNAPASIAIDGSGNIWVSNTGANPVSAFTGSGGVLPGSPYSGAGTSAPVSVAVTPK